MRGFLIRIEGAKIQERMPILYRGQSLSWQIKKYVNKNANSKRGTEIEMMQTSNFIRSFGFG